MNGLDDELVRELRSRSEDVGGHPIGMDSVRRTARRIVWRRRIAVGAAAAAVLAVAVPAGMAFTGGVDQGVGPIGRPTPTVTHAGPTPVSPTPTSPGPTTPTPTGQALPAGVVPLTTVGAPQGAAPGIVYLQGDTLHNGSTTLQLPGRYISITPYHGGWLAVEPRHAELVQLRQDSSGRVVQVGPPTKTLDAYAALAVNESGLVAWFESGGAGSPGQMVRAIATGMSDGQATVTIPPGVGGPHPVGFLGGGQLVYEIDGRNPQVLLTDFTPGTAPRVLPGAIGAADTSEALNRITALTKITDGGSCSAVMDPAGRVDWRTCHNLLGSFSPNSTYVAGYPAYFDALGPSGVTILDARTGKTVADFQRPPDSDLTVSGVAWEDDSHLLAIVHESGSWQILRLDTHGHVEAATEAVPGGDTARQFSFSARP